MRSIELTEVADFSDEFADRRLVATSVGPRREAVFLTVEPQDADLAFARDEGRGSFPLTKATREYRARFHQCRSDWSEAVDLDPIDTTFPLIQPLSQNGMLVVGARCRWHNGQADRNATVFDSKGSRIRELVFGDGIQEVQVDREGDIWVSYFDEGVFGNFGWNEPFGASGMLRLNARGEILWSFQPPAGFDFICDCYAMNVADDATWSCYYTDFPIVRVDRSGTRSGWTNRVGGASVLAVDQHRVLLFGGYHPHEKRCVLQTLGESSVIKSQAVELRLPSDRSLKGATIVGRDSILHAFTGAKWFQLDLREIEAD